MGKNSTAEKLKFKATMVKSSSLHVDYDFEFEVTVLKGSNLSHAIAVRRTTKRKNGLMQCIQKTKEKNHKCILYQQNIVVKPKKRKRVSTEEVQCDKHLLKKDFPTFDGGDYPIQRESQIVILEQTVVQKVLEVPNYPMPKPSPRIRHIGKYKKSPYMSLHSGDCSYAVLVPKQYFNLKHPFNVDIGVEPDLALRWAFGQFVDAGTYKKSNGCDL
nr:uncharacterized protein LOC117278183 [Nicotiana tomentosiformis]